MRTAIILFASGALIGWAADSPQFEVASVKPAAPLSDGKMVFFSTHGGPGTSDPGQVTYTGLALKSLLQTAYNVKSYQISGPAWLATERYDIAAKMPPDTTKEQFALMLQNLLAERFQLMLHHETKDLPLYELVVAKGGSKLKPWVADPNAPPPPEPGTFRGPPPVGKDGRPIASPGNTLMTITNGGTRMVMATSKQPVSRLADMLANQLGRPVIDKTGLTGEYDYSLEFSPEGLASGPLGAPLPPPPGIAGPPPANQASDQDSPSLLNALPEQLGLKLESKKGPVDILIIDRANKTPTEN